MERDTLEVLNSSSLDDSLTSIQWLCQLESNKLLEADRSHSVQNTDTQALIAMQHRESTNRNPYPKPHYSYATLIVLAINSSNEKRMTLQEIYTWIETNYPFYKFAKKGWKNSIRHNLSLHKFFIKEKRPSVLHGKGSYWRISPEGKENLMRDLLKQSHNNLQPPCTILPHDPNRKLRPIMPKPNGDMDPTKAVHYVPFVTCNYPLLFLPSSTGTSEGLAGAETSKSVSTRVMQPAESKTIASPLLQATPVCSSLDSETNRCQSVPLSDITREKSSKANRPPSSLAQHTKTKASGNQVANDRPKTRSPSNGAKLPNILRRKRKAQSRSPQRSAKLQSARRPSVSTPKIQPSGRSNTAAARIRTPRRPSMASAKAQLPVRASLQPTLAAINSGHHAAFSPKRNRNEFLGQNLNSSVELTSSPQNTSFDFLQYSFGSPGFSPLRSPTRFGTGLTPFKDEADSGIMVTPNKVGFGDLGFNWTPLKTGFTPLLISPPKSDTPSSQTCRKSLGLERIKETDESSEPSISW